MAAITTFLQQIDIGPDWLQAGALGVLLAVLVGVWHLIKDQNKVAAQERAEYREMLKERLAKADEKDAITSNSLQEVAVALATVNLQLSEVLQALEHMNGKNERSRK